MKNLFFVAILSLFFLTSHQLHAGQCSTTCQNDVASSSCSFFPRTAESSLFDENKDSAYESLLVKNDFQEEKCTESENVNTVNLSNGANATSTADSAQISDSNFVSLSEFTYAGIRRWTIDGSRPRKYSELKPIPAIAAGTAYLGVMVGLEFLQRNAWWKDDRTSFRVLDDWDYALQADKFGHFFAGYFMSYTISEVLMASGVSWTRAAELGMLFGWIYQGYVEYQDGFGGNFGFSPSDMLSNTVGAMYFLAQHYVPFLQNFTPKWQFIPTSWSGNAPMLHPTAVVDDYNATTIWMCVNVHNLLPESHEHYWPEWLQLAGGIGVRETGRPTMSRHFYLGLDLNLNALLPDSDFFLVNWLRQTFNYIRLPLPTIDFGPTTRFHLFYPFTISLGGLKF